MHERPATRRVTRNELYDLVWQTPMSRLAEQLGISGNGLAKRCDWLDVPYPGRGHWAKKAAGKPVDKLPLPERKAGLPEATEFYPGIRTKYEPLPQAVSAMAKSAELVAGLVVPDNINGLHPRVRGWIAAHRKSQKEHTLENRRRQRDTGWTPSILADLTERDLYRFRVTSAVFHGIEKAGGRVGQSPINGKVTFLIDGHEVECSIVEKLVKLSKVKADGDWTAYPDRRQPGLTSSGNLRVTITTHLEGWPTQWVETDKRKIADFLPQIVGTIIAAGPIMEHQQQERALRAQQQRDIENRRQEERRQAVLEERRWSTLREYAARWDERGTLLVFLGEIERRLHEEGDCLIAGSPGVDWLLWARKKVDDFDPFARGLAGMFDEVSGPR